jgi:DNA recombination protein RmuC
MHPLSSSILPLLTIGFALGAGVLVGWLAARPRQMRLELELARDRAVHAERLKAVEEARASLRAEFDSLSRDALARNNEEFLTLAETRLNQARSEAAVDIDARKKAIEDLLAPMKTTLDQVDREIKESNGGVFRAAASSSNGSRRSIPPVKTCAKRPGASPTPSSAQVSAAAGASFN